MIYIFGIALSFFASILLQMTEKIKFSTPIPQLLLIFASSVIIGLITKWPIALLYFGYNLDTWGNIRTPLSNYSFMDPNYDTHAELKRKNWDELSLFEKKHIPKIRAIGYLCVIISVIWMILNAGIYVFS